MVAMLDFQAARWTIGGEVPPQAGNHHPTGIPMGCFPTRDGHVNIAGSGGRLWRGFCAALGEPQWVDDPRFRTGSLRSRNRDELNALIAERLAQRTTQEWVELLTEHGVPVGPVNTIDQTFADPQVDHLQLVQPVDHGRLGRLGVIRNAVTLQDGPSTVRGPSPELGEHTEEILREIGFDPARIADLRARGVV
jgi:formyl-CoA transferase